MRITNLRSWRTTSGGIHVEADVDGEPLWFISDDAALTASPEAFASAMLIPAATRGEPLEVEAPVDRSWLEQVPAILRQAKEWWQLPGTRVIATDVIDTPRARPGTIAQCFTGGVDSFHAFIHAKTPPAVLVYAHGYDFQLKHRARRDAFLPGFRERYSVRREGGANYHQPAAAQRLARHQLGEEPWRRTRRIGARIV